MLVPDINAIHEIAPPLHIGGQFNRQLPLDQRIVIGTRGVSMPDKEQLDRDKSGLAASLEPRALREKLQEIDYAMMRKKFVYLKNYKVLLTDGGTRDVTTFDDFVQVAPPELIAWYFDVVQYGEKLSAAESRNFLPPSASPSGSQSGEAETSGSAETATAETSATAAT